MTKPILECNGIAAGYVKGLNILQGVDVVVNEGEIVSIIGPNGAGKSTLLKAIMSLIKVSAGRFFVNGEEKTNLSTHRIVMEGIGYVPQVANVFPSLTIDENLEIGSWSIKRNKKKHSQKFIMTFQCWEIEKRQSRQSLWGTKANISFSKSVDYISNSIVTRRTFCRIISCSN